MASHDAPQVPLMQIAANDVPQQGQVSSSNNVKGLYYAVAYQESKLSWKMVA